MDGIGGSIENLITRVSVEGVTQSVSDTRKMGMAMKVLSGDIKGAAGEWGNLSGMAKAGLVAGGAAALGGAGAGILAYMHMATNAAMGSEQATIKLQTALQSLGPTAGSTAQAILAQAKALQASTGYSDDALTNAAGILASFPALRGQIDQILPRLVDMDAGMRGLGKDGGKDLESWALLLGKGLSMNPAALKRNGVEISDAIANIADPAQRTQAILKELDREFAGQGRAFGETGAGSMQRMKQAIDDLNESMGVGLIPIIKGVTPLVTGVSGAFASINEHLSGIPGVLLAVTGGLFVLAAAAAPLVYVAMQVRRLKDEWAGVAVAAQGAAVAQSGAVAAGSGAGGVVPRGGGFGIGGGLKGIGIGMLLSAAGAGLSGVAQSQSNKFSSSGGKGGRAGTVAATMGAGVLSGAGIGASIGSIIPGVGTLVGGIAGALVGGIYSGVKGGIAAKDANKSWAKTKGPGAAIDPANRTANAVETMTDLLKEQNRKIIGGGARAAKYIPRADIDRAIMRSLSGSVA